MSKVLKSNKSVLLDTSWLFSTLFATYSFFMFIFWSLYMKNNPSETSDKLLFVGSAIFSLLSSYLISRTRSLKNSSLIVLFALISMSIGIFIKENQSMSREHVMGFGFAVLILAWILTLLAPYIVKYLESKLFFMITFIFSLFCTVLIALSFTQTRTTLIESQHSEYVVNELLAPSNGYAQFDSFIPQYTFTAGYFFNLIPSSWDVYKTIQVVVVTLTITAFLALFSAIFICAWFLKGYKSRWFLAIILVVPLTSVTAGWDRISYIGPPTTLLSGPAIRIFCGMVIAVSLFLFINGKNTSFNKIKMKKIGLLGLIGGFTSSINLDFGLAACLALYLTLILISLRSRKVVQSTVAFGSGFIFSWTLILIALTITKSTPKVDQFAWFIRQFGGGFGSIPISYPGPVMFALPTIFSIMVFSFITSIKYFKAEETEVDVLNSKISILTFYFSAWCFFSTPYYLNRSYHSGQMSTLYLPLSVAIAGIFALYLRNRGFSLKDLHYFVPVLIVAISISSIWISPNPAIELRRLQGNNADGNLPRSQMETIIKLQDSIKREMKPIGEFAYFGEEGNIIEKATNIKSANIFNNPLDMFLNQSSVDLQCKTLDDLDIKFLLFSTTAALTFAWPDGSLCDGLYLHQLNVEGFKVGVKMR